MAEQKESSVLFSLKELMNLEEDRIKQEEDDRKRKEEEALRAKLDGERKAREAEETRLRAAEEERRVQEQRSREEQARIDAIRQGEVEKARLDAENAARMEAIRHQQEHERQLVHMKETSGKKKLTFMIAGLAVLFVAGAIGGGIAIKNSMDDADRVRAEKVALEAKLTELDSEKKRIQLEIEKASGEEKERLMKQLADKEREIASAKTTPVTGPAKARTGGPGPAAKPKSDKPCNCQPGDPLCSCL